MLPPDSVFLIELHYPVSWRYSASSSVKVEYYRTAPFPAPTSPLDDLSVFSRETGFHALYFPACSDDVGRKFLAKVARADMLRLIYDGRSEVYRTALHWAIGRGNKATVQKLIKLRADINTI